MPPQLGLVCITPSTEARYKTVTRKRLLALAPHDQRALLDNLYRANIAAFVLGAAGNPRRQGRPRRCVGRTSFNDRQHADLIDVMPACYAHAPYIEIEAKAKKEAIQCLRGWRDGVY